MSKIKMISKDTDFSKVRITNMGWDAMIGDKKLDVYKVEGYYHSTGSRDNDIWAVYEGEELSYAKAFAFEGNPCSWSYKIEDINSSKEKWDAIRVGSSVKVTILRNNQNFYSFTVSNIDFALTRLRSIMFKIKEHPVAFHLKNYEKEIVGRRIYWREQPAIISRYNSAGNLEINPCGIERFNSPSYNDNVNEPMDNDGETSVMEDLFSPSIYWFRSNVYDVNYSYIKNVLHSYELKGR